MDREDLKIFHNKLERMFTILGDQQKCPLEMETPARNNARRSLVANSDIPEGTVIAREHLTWKRPAHGISPRDIEDVLGKQAARTILEDEVLQWKMVN
mgnify:FL=1